MMFTRFKHTLAKVKHCPPPTYDTGCTYCSPPSEILATVKSVPENISHTFPPLNRLVVHASGLEDYTAWPRKVEALPTMAKLQKFGRGNGNMVVMSSIPGNDLLLWPEAERVSFDLTNEDAIKSFFTAINKNENIAELPGVTTTSIDKPVILICAHKQRDERCGVIGAMLHDEFERVLKREGIDAHLGLVSHVGGHVYAGNVAVLKPDGTYVWYGLVRPSHVQGIVNATVVGNTVIEELCRQ